MSNKSVGFRLEFQGAQSTVDQLLDVDIAMAKITTRLKEFKKEGGLEKNVEEVRKLKLEQRSLQEQSKDLRKEQQQLINSYKNSKFPKDSLIGMRMEYNNLTREVERLDAAQRNSKEWRKKIQEANELNNKIKEVEASMGNFRRNVGNYPQGGALGQGIKGVAQAAMGPAGALMSGPLAAGVFAGAAVLSNFQMIQNYEQAIANLGAVSGATEKELLKLKVQSKDLGAITAYSATQVVNLQTELSKLGFVTEEILQMTKAVIDFGIAVDADAGRAATLAGATLRAFGKEAKDTEAVVGALAKQTLISASSFSMLETQLPIVASVAKTFGFSLEDTLALLGELSNRGFDASMSATALRNIFLNLADANGKLAKAVGGPAKTLPELVEKLQKLKDTGIDLNETLELTDKRSVAAFNSFLDGAGNVLVLREQLENVDGVLADLNKKRLNTLQGKITLLKSAWEGLALSIDDGNGALSRFSKFIVEATAGYLTGITAMNDGLLQHAKGVETLFAITGDADIIARLKNRQGIAQNQGGGRGRGGVTEDDTVLAARYSNFLDEINKKLTWANRGEQEWVDLMKDKKFYTDKLAETEKRQADAANKSNELVRKSLGDTTKKTKELVKGSIEFLENELQVAEKALKRTVLTDESAIQKAQAQIAQAKEALDNAKKSLRSVDEIELEKELEAIDTAKAARITALLDAGLEPEDFVNRMADVERKTDIVILETKLKYAKEGSKEREKLELDLRKKIGDANRKLIQENKDAQKEALASFLSEYDNELAQKLTTLNNSYGPQFGSADAAIDGAPDEKSYKRAVQEKLNLEKQFQAEVLKLTKETELQKIRVQLQFAEEGTTEYYQLKLKESQIEIELTRYAETEKDKIREEFFNRQKGREEERRKLILASLDFINDAVQTISQIELDNIQYEKDRKLEVLEEEYDRKRELADGNAEIEKRLDKEQAAERKKLEKEAFERSKRVATMQAIIQGAIAAVRVFADLGPVGGLAALPFVLGQTGLQIAAIQAQKFAKGGKIKSLSAGRITATPNVSPTPEGDSVLAFVTPDEVILNKRHQALLGGPETFARVGVPGFSRGGKVPHYYYRNSVVPAYNQGGKVRAYDYSIAPDALISNKAFSSNSSATMSDDQIMRMADMIALSVTSALVTHLPGALYQGVKEGAFNALNEDKRLKEREASSNLNSNL